MCPFKKEGLTHTHTHTHTHTGHVKMTRTASSHRKGARGEGVGTVYA
jgi:hypothetical protein